MILNRNKRGMAVNLKHPGGLEVVKKLIAGADVVTENYRKGTLEKLGLGYDVLEKINPRLVYCAISGYGRTGPYADKGGFDLIAQGFAGLMSITGEPGGAPAKSGTSVADINAGIFAALGIVSALLARERTGKGQVVETSLMEAAIQQTYWQGRDLLRHRHQFRADGLRRTSSPRPTRRSRRPMAGSTSAARTRPTGSAS
jgi:crotonobetainyl-CoA:carnitine CoA-transferase CaiB-like acyl-CoA transferase